MIVVVSLKIICQHSVYFLFKAIRCRCLLVDVLSQTPQRSINFDQKFDGIPDRGRIEVDPAIRVTWNIFSKNAVAASSAVSDDRDGTTCILFDSLSTKVVMHS